MKRTSNVDDSLGVENKKQKVISCLEDLSNELFCNIFDYLDGYKILTAFSNLNHRLQTLINHPSIPLKLARSINGSSPTDDFYQQVIQPNRNRLLSLRLCFELLSHDSVHYFIFDASFTRLESLTLEHLSTSNLVISCSFLTCLPRLTKLHLFLDDIEYVSEIGQVLCLILSLPVLRRCIIIHQNLSDNRMPKIMLPIAINSKPSPIEYLRIYNAGSVETIFSLLKHMPKIRYLDCDLSPRIDEITGEFETIHLPHLKQLFIGSALMTMNQCEGFLTSIGHRVEVLKLERDDEGDYLDAGRWERLIKKYLPHLKVFEMKCVDINLEKLGRIDDSIVPFYSKFWIEHGWFASVTFSPYEAEFFIHPCKKQWFDRHREIEIDWITSQSSPHQDLLDKLNKKPSRFSQVELQETFPLQEALAWIDEMKNFLLKVPFTQLIVHGYELLSCVFETISDSMVHLDSIILTSMFGNDLQCLFDETNESQPSFTQKQRITKVNIRLIRNMDEMQHVMHLFPRMEYLELTLMRPTIDVVTALKCILMNRSMKVPNLRSICFDNENIDREVLDQLRSVMDGERSIRKYHFKCNRNEIFVQWTLSDVLDI